MKRIEAEASQWGRSRPNMRCQVSKRGAINIICKFIDTVQDALNLSTTVVALVHLPVKDIETPDGIRDHIQKRQNSSVQYSKSA